MKESSAWLRALAGRSRWELASVLFTVAGLALALAWRALGGSPWPALIAFGGALIASGIAMIVQREVVFFVGDQAHSGAGGTARRHTGAAAMLFGSAAALPGAALAAIGVAGLLGHGAAVEAFVLARPGPVLLGVATCLALGGAGALVSRWTRLYGLSTAGWQRLPGRLLGLYFLALAALIAVVGAFVARPGDDWPALLRRLWHGLEAWLGG